MFDCLCEFCILYVIVYQRAINEEGDKRGGRKEKKKGEEEKSYAYVRPRDIAFQGSCTVVFNFYGI